MTTQGNGRLAPNQTFDVPEGVRYLSAAQAEELEQAFARWRASARTATERRSRRRLDLLFLFLRRTGARLGEALGLDESRDMDLDKGCVRLGNDRSRRSVPLPEPFCREMQWALQAPEAAGLEGCFFQLDPGYVRRVFYARAEACGLPRELAAPRTLRNTRAVELLRNGVPLAVVRDVLGQSSTDLTAVYQHYSGETATTLVRRLGLDDLAERTSARNTFVGRVTEVVRDGVMAQVRMLSRAGTSITAVITVESLVALGLEPEVPVVATIKAPLVGVIPGAEARQGVAVNHVCAEITSVRSSEVLTEYSGITGEGEAVCALVSASGAEVLGLSRGDSAVFHFKALSVVLNTV
ncbi:molybdate transport system regulatory protein [Paucidesulfovibrio gracilis DSM 16080]|uniref:Molybdate transport system regulatory protein n=1 Tax=Paucidesulfovibrio gracilis DSM 16080 TaxID=1121449 RepID=A0A1T4X6H8_9BACT|nr:TOBE domain-containing protein [Paucidesulfovibrio gracilis]SKA84708.1 molybdate transport system regulatory protein [Paucidesulfovibrio gracilis DSM 16080]